MKNKLNLILYYVGALLGVFNFIFSFYSKTPLIILFSIINIILVIIFTILVFKKTLDDFNLLAPITYIIFFIIMYIIIILFNKKILIPGLCTSYYITSILVGHLILNIYSILSFKTKKPIK